MSIIINNKEKYLDFIVENINQQLQYNSKIVVNSCDIDNNDIILHLIKDLDKEKNNINYYRVFRDNIRLIINNNVIFFGKEYDNHPMTENFPKLHYQLRNIKNNIIVDNANYDLHPEGVSPWIIKNS